MKALCLMKIESEEISMLNWLYFCQNCQVIHSFEFDDQIDGMTTEVTTTQVTGNDYTRHG